MTMPKLYLHIGYPKTGTTSLQQFLALNDATLAKAGILYPATGRMHNAHYGISFSLGLGFYHNMAEIQAPAAYVAALAREVAEKAAHTVILSSEYFSVSKTPQAIRDLLADYDVSVVCYLRRHDDALESAYVQNVKTIVNPPWAPSIDSFLDHKLRADSPSQDYLATLQSWAAVFGRERMIVRPFEKQQNLPNLYVDFLQALGIDLVEGLQWPSAEANTAIGSPDIVVAIDAVQRSAVPADLKRTVVGNLMRLDRKITTVRKTSWLSPAQRAALHSRFSESYAAIARTYMGRPDGQLYLARPAAADDEWTTPPRPGPQDLVNLVLSAVAPHIKA